MRKKLAALAVVATLTLGVTAPAPANARVQSVVGSSEAFFQNPLSFVQQILTLIIVAPVVMSVLVGYDITHP
ncbi:hypothetical protein [Corynebacterium lubricantis]|uniref:hypothetical protein n=1 Tax=Corynebacterium lubricantis TaxID=541095 RepID=UPI0003756498|nr:hypothetical protein [Corynebacterium lubricantis]